MPRQQEQAPRVIETAPEPQKGHVQTERARFTHEPHKHCENIIILVHTSIYVNIQHGENRTHVFM